MSDSLRLFVALWLPDGLRRAALARLEELRRGSIRVRWTKPEQLHLTLKFLGETPAAELPGIEEALARTAAAASPIHLNLAAGGVFPPAGPPRIIWLGLEPEKDLATLAAAVEQSLAPLGFAPEKRRFRPHLTLGRAEPGAVFRRELLAAPLDTQPGTVAALSLVQSELRPGGAVYTTVREWGLGGDLCQA